MTVEDDGPLLCGRCYDETSVLYPANCEEKPEEQIHLGMYHCPDCGAMVLGGFHHPRLCRQCLERTHPSFDTVI